MSKITSGLLLYKKRILLFFLVLCSLCMSEKVLTQKHWDKNHMTVSYDPVINAVVIKFEFYCLDLGALLEDAYLEYCDFAYSTDNIRFTNFMRAITSVQYHAAWSSVNMSNKLSGAKLKFIGCFEPADSTMWAENTDQRVDVYNTKTKYEAKAYLTIIGYFEKVYPKIINIQVKGLWHINGLGVDEYFTENYLPVLVNRVLTLEIEYDSNQKNISGLDHSKNSEVNLYTEADAIVISGVEQGKDIKVYSVSGAQINETVANSEIVKIQLPVNQIYIIKIGQTCYKVVL